MPGVLSWALGRCGSREDVSLLDTLIARNDGDEAVCRIAREAKFALLDDGMKDRLIKDVVAGLPASISESLSARDPLELTRVLRELLESGDASQQPFFRPLSREFQLPARKGSVV